MMNTQHTTKNDCPSTKQFTLYLGGKADDEAIVAFENHLKDCDFCKEALDGYKSVELFKGILKKPVVKVYKLSQRTIWLRRLGYAASIVLLFGIGSNLVNQSKNNSLIKQADKEQLAYINSLETTHQQKTLNHKSSGDYWYIGEKQAIVVNDQIIEPQQIEEASQQSTENRVYVQVENDDVEFSSQVIKTIKSYTKAAVLSYSKNNWFSRE